MIEIDVKGHSGCKIDIKREGSKLYILKSTRDPKYLKRLILQAEKQQIASQNEIPHIRVPKIIDINSTDDYVGIKMEYVYNKNFIEFFEHAGFEQVNYFIEALIQYIEYEIEQSKMTIVKKEVLSNKFNDVLLRLQSIDYLYKDKDILNLLNQAKIKFDNHPDLYIPIGLCHGDLTFSNILFNGNDYFFIDFLDSFIESPLIDLIKIRQDTKWLWSKLMYVNPYDEIRLKIVFRKIDLVVDSFFRNKYDWYREYYGSLELMNFFRILQYAHDKNVICYLKETINAQLEEI